jgi:hypothetical protein
MDNDNNFEFLIGLVIFGWFFKFDNGFNIFFFISTEIDYVIDYVERRLDIF